MYKLIVLFYFFTLIMSPKLNAQYEPNEAQSTNDSGVWVFDKLGNMVKTRQPIFQFVPSRSHHFGIVLQSEQISYDFEFINNGLTPLTIYSVKGTCYCTQANWTKQPIAPGQKGTIKVFYDTKARLGKFRAAVSIQSNAYDSQNEHLFVEGEIIKP